MTCSYRYFKIGCMMTFLKRCADYTSSFADSDCSHLYLWFGEWMNNPKCLNHPIDHVINGTLKADRKWSVDKSIKLPSNSLWKRFDERALLWNQKCMLLDTPKEEKTFYRETVRHNGYPKRFVKITIEISPGAFRYMEPSFDLGHLMK